MESGVFDTIECIDLNYLKVMNSLKLIYSIIMFTTLIIKELMLELKKLLLNYI